jgi:hypothetical protein
MISVRIKQTTGGNPIPLRISIHASVGGAARCKTCSSRCFVATHDGNKIPRSQPAPAARLAADGLAAPKNWGQTPIKL